VELSKHVSAPKLKAVASVAVPLSQMKFVGHGLGFDSPVSSHT
jgi:hypothetical protein